MAPSKAAVRASSAPPNPLREAETFADFFSRNHLPVFRYIYALHGHPQEAVEDLTAETFLRAWRSRRSFSGDERAALRWILRIARNLVIDTHRRSGGRPESEDLNEHILPSSAWGPEDHLVHTEAAGRLLYAIRSLPANQREMIVLRYLLGWRVKEIAAQMEMLENTVSVNLRRALASMRKNWPIEDSQEAG